MISRSYTDLLGEGLPCALPGQGERRVALILLHDEDAELVLLAPEKAVVVGRRPPADVCIPDSKLSRLHARFTLLADQVSVMVDDLGSTNGTWFSGERIHKRSITVGEEVRIGSVVARVQMLGRLAAPLPTKDDKEGVIISSSAMRELFAMGENVAASRVSVILLGETGTGKEVMAHFIHGHSPRCKKPIVRVNCAAIPEQLVESTLFGHERGAFTGAIQQHKGVFEEADGGTVFLDEIGELPPAVQVALLRVLETQRFTRVGSAREIAVDVRIIAATHRNLEEMVARGEFRSDLYYRLSTVVLRLPPLRDRRDEIEVLVRRFIPLANAANGRNIQGIAPDAMALLRSYDWPGNVRELRNVIERAVVLARTEIIRPQDLPKWVQATGVNAGGALPGAWGAGSPPDAAPQAERTANMPNVANVDADAVSGELRSQLQQYQARIIREALEAAQWRRTVAAERLGMPLRTLAHKMKTLGIRKPEL